MPAINFQERFADAVASGEKRQTIRKKRKNPIKVGDYLQLYTGMRTRRCRLLKYARCRKVHGIVFNDTDIYFWGETFPPKCFHTPNQFAQDDGFRDWLDLVAWFAKTHGLPFEGVLIEW